MWFPTTNWYQEEIKVDEEITESKHFNNSMVTIKEQFIKFIEDLRKLSQQQQEIEFLVARGNNWVQYGHHIKNRGKLRNQAQSIQEMEFLVTRGNKEIQNGHQT